MANAPRAHTNAQAQIHKLRDVALGRGCFFNCVLTQGIVSQLQAAGLNVLQTKKLPYGDAGLASGQAWVTARMMQHINMPVSLAKCALEAT
jgi:hydrogenase maturation protein HypF